MTDRVLIDPDILSDIGDSIRAKTGESGTITPANMASAISSITTGDNIDHEDLPSYVKDEARATAIRVQQKLKSGSIIFAIGSDSHQIEAGDKAGYLDGNYSICDATTGNKTTAGNLHLGYSLKAMAYALPLDFIAYLGDYTTGNHGTTLAEGVKHINTINADIDEAFRGIPQFRTVGNHDCLGYSYTPNGDEYLSQAQLYQLIGKYNAETGAIMGEQNPLAGYCYRDFPQKQLRVICINSADGNPSNTTDPRDSKQDSGVEFVSVAQRCWLADTLISTPQGYGIIVLSHHPLDWGKSVIRASHIIRAYVEELAPNEQNEINFGTGVEYDFTGKNKSAWLVCVHGHTHNFHVDDMHYVTSIATSTTSLTYQVKRIAVPCSNFFRNNEYATPAGRPEWYDIDYGDGTTYSKTADSGKDTSWTVFVINPSDKMVYAVNYGAGIDRDVSYDYTKTYYTVTSTLTHATLVGDGLVESGTAYAGVVTADNGYLLDSVTVTMSGNDVTSTAYDPQTGEIRINEVTGNIAITAVATVVLPYTNLVRTSVDVSGNIYNGTGYKAGWRFNSSGVETEASEDIICGFIPYDGEVIRAGYLGGSVPNLGYTGNYFVFYDANKQQTRIVAGNTGGYSVLNGRVWTLDPDDITNSTIRNAVLSAKYLRVSIAPYKTPASDFTVTLNEPF